MFTDYQVVLPRPGQLVAAGYLLDKSNSRMHLHPSATASNFEQYQHCMIVSALSAVTRCIGSNLNVRRHEQSSVVDDIQVASHGTCLMRTQVLDV